MSVTYAPEATTTLETAITDVLIRLGDTDNDIWNRAEIGDYVKDGYDQFCTRTKVLFDIHVIENLPITGNWQTDLEKSIAETKSGFALTNQPFHFTGEHERNLGTGGRYGQSMSGPAPSTDSTDNFKASNVNSLSTDLPSKVPGGLLPQSTIEVLRVTYDDRELTGMSSQHMRDLDPHYETRDGDPQFFVHDKDGIYFLRVVPAAQGDATYDTVNGTWGTLTQRAGDTIDNPNKQGFGVLRYRDDFTFYNGGPWGSPTRIHPEAKNIEVDVYRLGRDLSHYPMELPLPYQKYVMYWALYQALDREGSGQQLELANHYRDRFEMGVLRLTARKRDINPERIGSLGRGSPIHDFALGEAQAPHPYGQEG